MKIIRMQHFLRIVLLIIVLFSSVTIPLMHMLASSPLAKAALIRYKKRVSADEQPADYVYRIDGKYAVSSAAMRKDRQFLETWFSVPGEKTHKKTTANSEARFIDNALNQDLIITRAMEEGVLESDDFKIFLWIQVRNAMVQYYLKTKAAQDHPGLLQVSASQKEIYEFYARYKTIYDTMGLSREQALVVIRSTLITEKRRQALKTFEAGVLQQLKLERNIEFTHN